MTPQHLETLRGLVGLSVVTTETPWYCRPSSMTVVLNKSVSPDAVAITLVADCFVSLNSDAERKANAQFIAASRNAIPTNGASQYKEIAWYSAGRNLSNPFDAASGPDGAFKDSVGYQRFLPSYFGRAITHWMPLPAAPENDDER